MVAVHLSGPPEPFKRETILPGLREPFMRDTAYLATRAPEGNGVAFKSVKSNTASRSILRGRGLLMTLPGRQKKVCQRMQNQNNLHKLNR